MIMHYVNLFLIVIMAILFGGNPIIANAQSDPDVRLVLQITVDGLRGDLLNRYQAGFGDEGFRYLLKQGTIYTNAQYQYANTETIVGHTTLATGTFPSQHGMIGNVWFDREAKELAYNIEDAAAPLLPTRDEVIKGEQVDPAQKLARTEGRSPMVILAPTFSDGLAAYYGGRAKVFGVSGKDRSAVAWRAKPARHSGSPPIMAISSPAVTIMTPTRIGPGVGTNNESLKNMLVPNGHFHLICPPTFWQRRMTVLMKWT
jgi:hypothetical protein